MLAVAFVVVAVVGIGFVAFLMASRRNGGPTPEVGGPPPAAGSQQGPDHQPWQENAERLEHEKPSQAQRSESPEQGNADRTLDS